MDLVLNHSSDEHRWFLEAKKSKDNPYHDYYVWRDGKEGELPNDMKACFGGSCWEWVPEVGQYYFHQFSVKQPDLNWENPKLRQEIYNMILWWMDKGVGGFRLDVIDQIAKEPDQKITQNGPRLHEFIRELSRETFQKGALITVGEAWGADVERAKLYSNPDGSEFSMVFQFEHIHMDQLPGKEKWDLSPLRLVELKQVYKNGRPVCTIAVGTVCSGIITICQESCPAGAMIKNIASNQQKCWRRCCTACRARPIFTRARSLA